MLELLLFLALLVLVFLLAGVLSPFEALGWWAGWYGDEDAQKADIPTEPVEAVHAERFVVFLSGINSVSGESLAEREIAFLERLNHELTGSATVLVDDIFPYSVTERALTGRRVFAWFWRWIVRTKISGAGAARFLINIRNLWQVAVSADSRYGPIYNQGSATMILHGLRRNGYTVGSGVPITLIGYSGGGQVALGAAPHLKRTVQVPISIISLGGVMSADPGVLTLEHLYHLYGARDNVQRLGSIFFPGRWPAIPSPWNTAKKHDIVELVFMGPSDHTGPGGYLDEASSLPDGRSYLDATVETMTRLIQRDVERKVRVHPVTESP